MNDLRIVQSSDRAFEVHFGGTPLLTNMGGRHPVKHTSSEFLEHMVMELSGRGQLLVFEGEVQRPIGFDSYSLFSLQKDWIEPGTDNLTTDMLLALLDDPLLEYSANPETWGLRSVARPVEIWLSDLGVRLVDLDYVDCRRLKGIPENHWRTTSKMGDDDHEAFVALRERLQHTYDAFSVQQKSVATYLTNISSQFLLFSMCLAAGRCEARQYGEALAIRLMGGAKRSSRYKNLVNDVSRNAQRALDFIELSS